MLDRGFLHLFIYMMQIEILFDITGKLSDKVIKHYGILHHSSYAWLH